MIHKTSRNQTLEDLLRDHGYDEEANLIVSHGIEVGKQYIIRTLNHIYVGRAVAVSPTSVKLEQAAWIADTGRWGACLRDGFESNAEIEVYPRPTVVGLPASDITEWPHELPKQDQ